MANYANDVEELAKDTNATRIQNYAEMAAESFSQHVITPEGPNQWFCGRPKTGMYSFRVLTPPGATLVYGDIGDLFLSHSGGNSLEWLQRAAEDSRYSDYALGKCPTSMRSHRFFPGDALAYLEERREQARQGFADGYLDEKEQRRQLAEIERVKKQWLESRNEERGDAAAWAWASYSITGDAEWPNCKSWGSDMVWCWNALCWFVENLKTLQPA